MTLIFFSFAMPLFAETYRWTGGGDGINWNDEANWEKGILAWGQYPHYPADTAYIDGSFTVNINDTGLGAGTLHVTNGATLNVENDFETDTAYIAGDVTVNMDADFTAHTALNIQKETTDLTSDWTTKFTGSKKLTFGAMDFNRASSTGGVIGTLEVNCPMECSGTIITHSGTTLSVKGGKTLTAQKIENQVSTTALPATIENAGTITLSATSGTALSSLGPVSNSGTIEATAGYMAFADTVTNTGTLQTNAGAITFSGKVTGASGTISTTTGNITTSAAAASSLGTVQSSGGTISNTGSGAVTLTELQMGADTSVTNSTGGALAITKLTGNSVATLTAGTNAITVSSYDGAPTIEVAAGSCALGTGTIAALTVDASAEAAIAGSLTVTGATTNAGTISVGANSITFAGAVASASGTVTMTTGGVTVSGAAASAFGTVQCAGGAFTNSGSGSTNVADFVLNADSVVTNSAGGTLTLTKLSGAYNATIKSVSADNGITVNSYDAAAKITVAASSKNILLASGTLDRLAISGGAKATISGDMTTTSGITNNGTLATSAALLINGAVTNGGTIEAAANDITFNGTATNTGTISATTGGVTFAGAVAGASGTISTTTGNITTSAATASSLGTVQTTSGSLTNSGAGNVAVADFAPGAATSVTNIAAGSIALAKITSAAATSLSGDIKAASYSDGLPIIVDAATGTSDNNVDLGAGKPGSIAINAGGKTTISGDIETSGGITNAGTLDASAAKITMTGASAALTGNTSAANTNIKDFVYAPTDTTGTGLAVAGSNTFTNFTCLTDGAKITLSGANTIGTLGVTSGGGTLAVDAAQTITGALTLKGESGSALSVAGTGSLNIASNQSAGEYLSVAHTGPAIGGGSFFYTAGNSSFTAAPLYGQDKGWIFLDSPAEFVWTGATSADWAVASNWNYNMVPGLAGSAGVPATVGYPVKIPSAANQPELSGSVSYSISDLTINDASASLTLSSTGTVSASGTLTNKGMIYYSSIGRVTNETGTFINDNAQGTVAFNGSGAADLASVQYYNLTINGSGTYTAAGDLTVKHDLTQSTGTFTANAALTVTNALAVSGAASAYFNNDAATDTATSAASATFSTTGTISLGNTAGDTFTTTAALDLPSTLGALSLAGTITAGGTGVTIGHNAVLNANTNFASDTKTNGNVTLSGPFTVTNAAATLDTSAGVLTLENANLVNTGAVTNGNIKFTGTTDQTFTPNEASTYDSVAIDKASNGSVTVDKAITSKNLAIHQAAGKNATFEKKATVSDSFTDTSNAGNILFNAGCDFTPAATFNTTGTLTLNGATNPCNFTGGLTHTAGLTSLYGTLSATNAAITLGATSIDAATTIATNGGAATFGATSLNANLAVNSSAGAATFQETVDGAFALVSNGSGLLTLNGAVGGTTPPTQLTAAGPVAINAATKINGPITGSDSAAINAATSAATITVDGAATSSAPSITTTGLQLYKGNLTFTSNCVVTGTVQAAANVATSAAVTVTFTNDVWLYTSAAAALGGSGGSLSVAGNLYFAGASKNAAIASNVTAKNVLLLHGTVDIGSAATLASSTGDMILLGAAYDIDDTNEATASQVTGLFAYKHDSRKKAASYTADFPTACPDGTAISSSYSGTVSVAGGAAVSAGVNFYANGLAITGSGAWTLNISDNNLQTAAFAEIYNSSISNCSANHDVAAAEHNTVTACANIVTSRPVIAEAWTVYDDAIYISFKDSDGNPVTIENSDNEISAAASRIFNSAGAFAGTYIDADCQNSTNGKGDIADGFFIKSNYKWNTDAMGTSAGGAESTDRSGLRQTTTPYLNLPKALAAVYETLRDSSKNRIAHYYSASPDTSAASAVAGKTFTAVVDKCAPVLTQVLTGQELHAAPNPSDPASQKDYDAHNFVEFVYSEPVDISGGSTSVLDSDVNIRAAADLGEATNSLGGISFAGLAKIASGNVISSVKSGSGSPHSLYRNFSRSSSALPQDQSARIRVSIAGYVDGTVSAAGGVFKNWIGYISSAASPSGAITRIANTNIKDRSPAKNSLDINSSEGHRLPDLSAFNSDDELYGAWDVTPPSFAPVRINGSYKWERPATDGSQEYEIVGASYSTGTLDAIELHWFDNEPTYTENRQWFSRIGWADASSPTEYGTVSSYAADVRGGSKPDSSASNATAGGIRYCSLYDANNAFTYAVDGTSAFFNFTQNIKAGAESSLFTYAGNAPGAATHATGTEDGLYCKLTLDQTGYRLQTTFILTFNSNDCFVTDLAGNRIQCGLIKIKSIDRTPPAFTMSAVPLGTKQMMIIFSKPLNTDTLTLYTNPTDYTTVSALEYFPKSLELTSSSGTGIQIDQSVPARCLFKTRNATGMLVTLNQNAVLNDVTKGVYVTAKSGGYNYDPLSGIVTPMTYIQDAIGNSVVENTKHAFSDFAVNAIQPQYAYDNSLTDEGSATGFGLYQDGSWAVRDWNAEQANYGTISANKEIIVQTSLYDGTNDKSGGYDSAQSHIAFFSASPTAGSVSTEINRNAEKSWRVWQPNYTSDIFGTLAQKNNMSYVQIQGTANDSGVMFDIPKDTSSSNWKNGDQVSFMFKIGNYTVDHFGDGTQHPLYAVRLKDLNDITSIDLWSFKIRTTTLQRGGVTILNNVIDLNSGENTVVQVDMKGSGNLNVIVMTLDGNIIKYLRHGHTDAGTHYYNWNGTNNGGSKVARGLYFVRVIGPGIDETRKVMCVK